MGISASIDLTTALAFISGAFIALVPVLINNYAQKQRLKTQLDHDQKLKDREREMSLRTDIYLAAADATGAGLAAVIQCANLDIPQEKITEEFGEKFSGLGKINIVAGLNTVRAVVDFSCELSATLLRLMTKRQSLVAQQQQINRLSTQGTEVERSTGVLIVTYLREYLPFLEEMCDDIEKLGRLQILATLSIRKELDLPIDETEFRRISEEGTAKHVSWLKDLIQQLQSRLSRLPGG